MQSDWSTRRGSFVAASVLLMIACGGGQANPEPEAASAERPKASERIEAVEAAETCPDVSRLTVRSTNGAYPKAPPDWSAVKSVLAERTLAGLGGDSTAIVVYLANASLSLAQMKDGGLDLPASDAFVRIAFTNGAGHASAGRYRPSPEYAAEMRVDAGVKVTGRTTVQLSAYKTEGSAEITELTADRVCGVLELKDPWTSISGSFTAALSQ